MKATLKIETITETVYTLLNLEEGHEYNEESLLIYVMTLFENTKYIIMMEAKNEGYNQQPIQDIMINTSHIVKTSVLQIGETRSKQMK